MAQLAIHLTNPMPTFIKCATVDRAATAARHKASFLQQAWEAIKGAAHTRICVDGAHYRESALRQAQ